MPTTSGLFSYSRGRKVDTAFPEGISRSDYLCDYFFPEKPINSSVDAKLRSSWSQWIGFLSTALLGLSVSAAAQCPTFSASVPATACSNEELAITNTTTGASYAWDFCPGDLANTPALTSLGTISGTSYVVDVVLKQDGGNWFGFVVDLNVTNLIRHDFGSNPRNSVVNVSNLGNPGGFISSPSGFDIAYIGSTWYGVLVNGIDNNIVLYNFGNSLTNTPTASIIYTGVGGQYANLVLVPSGTGCEVLLSEFGGSNLRIIHFANGLTNTATGENVFNLGGGFNPIDVQAIEDCGSWYVFVAGFTNKVMARLDYGSSLNATPTMTTFAPAIPFYPYRLKALRQGGQFFCFITDIDGGLARVDIGNNISTAPSTITSLGTFGVMVNSWSIDVVDPNGICSAFTVNGSSGVFSRFDFPDNCSNNVGVSTSQVPQGVKFTSAGTKGVSLTVYQSGNTASKLFTVSVNGNQAPTVDMSYTGACVNNAVNFSATAAGGTGSINYAWNFGDAGTSTSAAPAHTYAGTGVFSARVRITDANLCTATIAKNVSIYNPPVAQFSLPSSSPVCSNQLQTFVNTSTSDPGSGPTWQWQIDGSNVASTPDLSYAFNGVATYSVRLAASIPGCSTQSTQPYSVQFAGPQVDFSTTGNCVNAATQFSNLTSGAVTGYTWTFGDAGTSTATSPSHTYSSNGDFNVKLTASNSAGCNNSVTKTIKLYNVPQPDFAVSLPPFSCSNSLTLFQNNTPSLTDSNITSWQWQFGDAANGTASGQVGSYTYLNAGTFNVSLTAGSDRGCTASVVKPITIAAGPVADFTVGPSCLNLATKFTDQSSGAIQSRNWQIGSSIFTTTSPTYTFTSTGDFPVTLTVSSANGCITVKTKTLTVPQQPSVNFNVSNLCAGKDALFSDATTSPQDVVTGWNWNFDGNSVTGSPATYAFPSSGSYNVKLTTTHASGCKYTLSRNVAINATPVAGFTASPDRGEAPLTVHFTNTSQQAVTYAWKFYDKVLATSTSASPTYTFTSLGDYAAELTATNSVGCSDVKTVPIKVLVPVIDLALTGFSLATDPLTAKLKAVITIANNGNVSVSYADVAVILADKAFVNETVQIDLSPGQTVTKTLSTVFAADANAFLCTEIISEKDVQPLNNKQCINFESSDYFFSPYPNPVSGILYFDWISSGGTTAITIYDSFGKVTFAYEVIASNGLNRMSTDLSGLSAGIYFVSIRTASNKKTMRVVHQ